MPSDFTPRFCIKDHFFGEISLLKLSFLLLRKNELFWRSEILIQNQDKKSRSIIRDGGDSKLVGKNQRSVTIFNWIYMHIIQISVFCYEIYVKIRQLYQNHIDVNYCSFYRDVIWHILVLIFNDVQRSEILILIWWYIRNRTI